MAIRRRNVFNAHFLLFTRCAMTYDIGMKVAVLFMMLACCLCSCETKFPISFHMEQKDDFGKSFKAVDKFTIREKNKVFDRAPFLSGNDMQSYRSFPAQDGTYGVVFNVKRMMWSRLEAFTTNNLGSDILPMVNGHPMEVTHLYNKPITSGKIVIWGGFTPADLAVLADTIPPENEEKEQPILNIADSTKPNLSVSPQEWAERQKEKAEEAEERKVISEKRGRF